MVGTGLRSAQELRVVNRGQNAGAVTRADATAMAAAAVVRANLEQAHDATLDVAQGWTDRLVGLPFTVLSGHGSAATVLGRGCLNSAVEAMEMAVAAQQRSIEQFLAVQKLLVGQMVDTGSALAAAAAELSHRPGRTPA